MNKKTTPVDLVKKQITPEAVAPKRERRRSASPREVSTKQTERQPRPGYRVIEREITENMLDGTTKVLNRSWVVEHFDGKFTTYYGSTLSQHVKAAQVYCGFDTKEAAEKGCRLIYEMHKRREENATRVVELEDITTTLVRAILGRDFRQNRMQIHLTLDPPEARKIAAMRIAMRQTNAEYKPGRPVVNNNDVIKKWLSEQPEA